MTLLDYISFMEDKTNIDKYVFIKKEKTVTVYTTVEDTITNEDGTSSIVTREVPQEQTSVEIYKCTFLEGGGIKKELYTQEMVDALIAEKQDELAKLNADKQIVSVL